MSEVSNLHDQAAKDAQEAAESSLTVTEIADDRALSRGVNRLNGLKRFFLLGVIPALIVAGAVYAYLHAGRYVDTENAYVQSDTVFLTAEVSGIIVEIPVQMHSRSGGISMHRGGRVAFYVYKMCLPLPMIAIRRRSAFRSGRSTTTKHS